MEAICPCCGEEFDMDHDNGFGYDTEKTHRYECPSCGKMFVFTTAVLYLYETERADCLNGGEHDYQLTHTFPKEFSKMRCSMCGEKRELTESERSMYGIGTKEDYFGKLRRLYKKDHE